MKEVRHCPSCYVLIEKNLGCNHMLWYLFSSSFVIFIIFIIIRRMFMPLFSSSTRCGRHFLWSAAPTYHATRHFNRKK